MELIISQLTTELKLRKEQVEAVIKLIDEGNTIPFIARYRKEMTGGADDEVLRTFDERLKYIRNLEERKSEVIKTIDEQGKLTEELEAEIRKAKVLQRVEDLYRPYKQKKRTRAIIAKERGLEPLALSILIGTDTSKSLKDLAKPFVSEENDVLNEAAALAGASDIIAEMVSDNAEYREFIRKDYLNHGLLITKATKKTEAEKSVYEMYYEFSELIGKMPSHRILAVNRGEKEEFLKVTLETRDDYVIKYLCEKVLPGKKDEYDAFVKTALEDSYKRLISPSVEREVKNIATENAELEAIKVFGLNTKPLLLQAPVKDVMVLAVDPSFRTGCKLVVLDRTGKLLDYKTIYPNAPQNDVEKSRKIVIELINKYEIDIVPIGNGTASRETESFIAETIKGIDRKVYYTIVSEAGASVYSASKLASKEYPDLDVSIRGAISIGRRLQDPMAELVKIDTKSIGVGQYQHDLNQKKLDESLTAVVEDCVNGVGVDLNIATPSLLSYVSGISASIADNIVKYRDENGKYGSRAQLKKVPRLGPKAFEQCAGFLRISDGKNPLDSTAVHPESYTVAKKLIEALGYTNKDLKSGGLGDIEQKINEYANEKDIDISVAKLAEEFEIGKLTLKDIIGELKKPGRDPREDMPKPVFRSDVLSIADLSDGMEVVGTVRNVVAFGAFVDIGIKTDGLVHISQLSDKFVKNPMDVVSVGDTVNAKIIGIDRDRGKVSLSMKGVKQ